MAITINVQDVDGLAGNLYAFGTLSFSGSYSTGGDTLDWTGVTGQIPASQGPVQVSVFGTTGDSYGWVKGSPNNLNNGKVKINTASNTELAAGAYPARIAGDANIYFEAVFNKLL